MENIPQPENLNRSAPPPISKKLTHAIIAINAVVFLLMVLSDTRAFTSPGVELLIDWGANYKVAAMSTEPWRLVTYMFLHIGILHLAFNMYVLNDLGPIVNELFGRRRFILIYLLTGIGSGIASAWWKPDVLSAGASGAIFGLVGCLIGYFYIHRNSYDPTMISKNIKSLLGFVAINVYFGFNLRGIDNAAHLGGLCCGVVAGILLAPRPVSELQWKLRSTVSLIIVLVIIAGGAVLARGRVESYVVSREKMIQEYELLQQQRLEDLALQKQNLERMQKLMPLIQEMIKNDPRLRNKRLRVRFEPKGSIPPAEEESAGETQAPTEEH